MILLIDNYDSFVFNLARHFERLGQATHVVRADAIDAAGVAALGPQAIVLSPGPCRPEQAGCCLQVVSAHWSTTPILGVCLGHQAIAAALGARIIRAQEPVHGRASNILHHGAGVFEGLPNPLTAARYHSLVVDEATLPDALEVIARSASGEIMAVQHHTRPVVGLQFHPESILTEHGYALLAAFLRLAGCQTGGTIPARESELATTARPIAPTPLAPVTF